MQDYESDTITYYKLPQAVINGCCSCGSNSVEAGRAERPLSSHRASESQLQLTASIHHPMAYLVLFLHQPG